MKLESMYMILGALLFLMGYLLAVNIDNYLENKPTLSINDDNNCINLSLELTAKCLNKKVISFYKYNITNLEREMNLSELKELGGVCHDYAEYYYDNTPNNFYRKKVTMDLDNETSHMITIISDSTGYCSLDQINYDCTKLRSSNETN